MGVRYVIFDVETTGLMKTDEVIQFGALVAGSDFRPEYPVNFYCYTQEPISPGAAKANGMNKKKLMGLSGGKSFEDSWLELPFVKDGGNNTIWVSYSSGGFDTRLINQTLSQNGLPKMKFGNRVIDLRHNTKFPCEYNAMAALKSQVFGGRSMKLSEVCASSGLTETKLDSAFNKAFKDNIARYHDALYDSFALWAVLYNYREILGLELH